MGLLLMIQLNPAKDLLLPTSMEWILPRITYAHSSENGTHSLKPPLMLKLLTVSSLDSSPLLSPKEANSNSEPLLTLRDHKLNKSEERWLKLLLEKPQNVLLKIS